METNLRILFIFIKFDTEQSNIDINRIIQIIGKMTENMEPKWLTIAEAAEFYKVSRSSMDRWLRENTDLFISKTEGGKRFVDIVNSSPPTNARLKEVKVPEGYLTLEQAREYYKLSRSAVHSWIREGYLKTDTIANRTYVDSKNSNPLNTRHEPEEQWRDVPGFDLYQASKDGRIRNKETFNVLKPNTVQNYHQVMLYKDGVKVPSSVHRIIAQTYIPNPENKKTVNHKNHNSIDNCVDNLEWYTQAEQNSHKKYLPKQKEIPDQMDQEDELWKPCSIEGYYISNYGRICDCNYDVINLYTNRNYIEVKIKTERLRIHREVAKVFLPNYTEDLIVNHKDGNTHNNHVSNLEMVTQSANVFHAYEIGKCKNRVVVIQKKEDGAIIRYKSIKEAAENTGLKKDSIGYASKHKTNLGGYEWYRE